MNEPCPINAVARLRCYCELQEVYFVDTDFGRIISEYMLSFDLFCLYGEQT